MKIRATGQVVHPYRGAGQDVQGPSIAQVHRFIGADLVSAFSPERGPETPADGATLLVLDSFERFQPDQMAHGEAVRAVCLSRGLPENSIRSHERHTSPYPMMLLRAGPDSPSERLDAFIEYDAAELVESTNLALKQHTGEGSSIKTINQSQSVSGLTTAQFLLDSALVPNGKGEPELTRIGDVLYQGLGKPADVGELQQRLFDRIDKVYANSKLLAGNRRDLNQTLAELKERGVQFFVPGGNEQEYYEKCKKKGVRVPESLLPSVLSVPNAHSVGAIDTKGTATPDDDEVAGFSVREPNVKYLAPGVDISVSDGVVTEVMSGTSFSPPYAAASYEKLRQENPQLSGSQLHHLLAKSQMGDDPHGPLAVVL